MRILGQHVARGEEHSTKEPEGCDKKDQEGSMTALRCYAMLSYRPRSKRIELTRSYCTLVGMKSPVT
jgi:hypothetical protein